MSKNPKIDGDFSELDRGLDEREARIKAIESKNIKAAESVETQTKKSFNEVMGMMRASYMMVSGLAQVMGGDLSQIFSSMFGIAISAIGTWKAISAAMAASGVGAGQAAIMFMSLMLAITQLLEAQAGQDELAKRVGGLNMALHGFGQAIGSWGL